MIKLIAIGTLGRDAETKNVNGKTVIEFSVAHTEKFMSMGQEQSRTIWLNCSHWTEKTGVVPYLKKGTQVYVEGNPSTNAYTNKEGKVVADFRLRIITIQLIGSRNNQAESPQQDSSYNALDTPNYDTSTNEGDLPF